jgi:hypothetical protein
LAYKSSTTHVFVDGNHFLALIPTSAENITSADDAETLEFLRLWYCEYQSRRSLGELLLPKKLKGIDKVQVLALWTSLCTNQTSFRRRPSPKKAMLANAIIVANGCALAPLTVVLLAVLAVEGRDSFLRGL